MINLYDFSPFGSLQNVHFLQLNAIAALVYNTNDYTTARLVSIDKD